MTPTRRPVDLIDRLGAAALEVKDLIRQAHEANQMLRDTIREARVTAASIAADSIEPLIEAEVTKQLDELGKITHQQMKQTAAKIGREFDALSKPMFETLGLVDEFVRLRESRVTCPSCGEKIDDQTAITDTDEPEAGDCGICAYCGALHVFTGENGEKRSPTPDELIDFMADPGVRKVLRRIGRAAS